MGIDFNIWNFVDRQPPVDEDPLKVVSVGRLSEMKGHVVLIDAISKVKRRGTYVQLKNIGEGTERSRLETQMFDLKLEAQLTLEGAQSSQKVANEYEEADVFTLTGVEAVDGTVETQGMVYIEAQATGLPVIRADIGGVSESIDCGRSGILTAEGDVEAIADALVAYAENPRLRLAHGYYGAQFVRSKFGLTEMLNAFETLYVREAE